MNGAKCPSRIHPALFYSSEIHFRAGEVGQLPNALSITHQMMSMLICLGKFVEFFMIIITNG